MLNKSNVSSVIAIAQQLQDNGYKLALNPKVTLLDAVMRANEVNYAVAKDSLEDVLVNRSTVKIATIGFEDGSDGEVMIPNAHTQAMDELTTAAAKAITVISTLVRTHINPAVKKIANSVYQAVDSNIHSDITDFGYTTRNYNAIYNSGVIEDLVSRFTNPTLKPLVKIDLPAMSDADLADLVKTANTDITTGLTAFVRDNADGLSHVYDLFFRANSGAPNPFSNAIYTTPNGDVLPNIVNGNLDVIAVATVMANALVDNPPAGTKMDLDTYNGTLADIRIALGYAVSMVLQERASQIRQRLLILEYPMVNKTTFKASGQLVMNGDLLEAYYNAGIGMDEVIGSALTARYSTLDELVAHKDELREAYRLQRDASMVNRTINRQQFINQALVAGVDNYFMETDEAILEPTLKVLELANKGELRDLVLRKVRDDAFHNRVLENEINLYLINLFGNQIFVNPSLSDFLRIFNDIAANASTSDGDDDVRQHATYTAIVMLTNMFAEAVQVKRS